MLEDFLQLIFLYSCPFAGIGIGLGEGDVRQLNEIVSDPNEDVFTADDPERLKDISSKIVDVLCQGPNSLYCCFRRDRSACTTSYD